MGFSPEMVWQQKCMPGPLKQKKGKAFALPFFVIKF
jgi:hypothetical protein